MKSFPFPTPFLATEEGPEVWIEDDDLYIRTRFCNYVASVFSYRRVVCVSKTRRLVEIKARKWWRWETPIRIPFSKIDYVDLVSPERPTSECEIYDLYLFAKGPWHRVHLWRFGGIEATGPIHREMAQGCANLIVELANTRLGLLNTPYEMPLSVFKDKYVCNACGHRLHPDSEVPMCRYCGGKDIRIE